MASPPQPPRRTKFIKVVDNEWKTRLTESFEGFNSSQVSKDHLEKAEECIKYGGTRDERYRLVPFERILNENQELGKADYLTSMTSAYDLLLKFVINLLKPNRPPVWRSIKTNNTAFRARVACMRGYEDILKTAGYTEKKEDSLQFPESVQEPDKQKLYVIAAELLMARLEVDNMNPASQSQQQQQIESSSSPFNQRRAQTAVVSSNTGTSMGGGGVSNNQWGNQQGQGYRGFGGGQMQHQQPQQSGYQQQQYSSRTSMQGYHSPGFGSSQSVAMQPGYGDQAAMQREVPIQQQFQQVHQQGFQSGYRQEYQSELQQDPQLHQQQLSQHCEAPRFDVQAHGQEQWHRSQSVDTLSSNQPAMNGSTRAATENLGRPKPTPRKPRVPRKTANTPDRSLSHQSSQGSISSTPSSSTSSLASPTLASENEEPPSAKKNVYFELSAIPEGKSEDHAGGENDGEDDFLKSIRMRRLAAKNGKKNMTAEDLSTGNRSSLSEATASASKTYSRTTVQREPDPLSQLSPSPSSFRRPLTPLRVEPLPQIMPTPTPSGQSEVEESDDSSSEKYSTPPTTAEQLATTESSSHTPQDTPTPITPSSSTSECDPALEKIRRRRLELKQQREQSGKKSDASDSPPTTTETKTEMENLPPSVGPTQLSAPANSSQYTGGGTESHQTYTGSINPSLSTGIYCPKCHCRVSLGQKYCGYCGEAVYMLFTNKAGAGRSTAGAAANSSEGVDMSTPYSAHPQPSGGQLIRPDPNAPTLPPKPGPRSPSKVTAAAEHNFLYDLSGHPKRASVPPEKEEVSQQPSSSYHQHHHQAARQQQQYYQGPLRARVDDHLQHPSAYSQYRSEKATVSSQAASAVGGGAAGAGASGYTPSSGAGAGIRQYSLKLEKYREFLHTKGKSDDEIDRDPEYLKMVKEEMGKQQLHAPNYGNASGYSGTTSAPGYANALTGSAKVERYVGQQSGISSQSKKMPDVSEYRKVDLMAVDYSSENQQAMEKLKYDGQELLNWIKRCVPFGYSLDEIQIASDFIRKGNLTKAQNPLQFLDSDWARMTMQVQNWVANTQSERRPFVGKPTEEETRKALVETKGQERDAVDIIYRDRKQKVENLRKRVAYMKSIQPTVPDLTWANAVNVLSVNGMDVNRACYALQCDWLQPLYESINSEHKKLKQEEMAEIKAIVSKKDETFSKEARCRMLMAECEFDDQNRAQLVLDLMEEVENDDNNYPLHYYVDAAHDFEDLQSASEFLFKECPIQGFCAGDKIPIHEMITMPGCTHSLCKECFKGQFQVVIQGQGVKHFNCPICQKPDMSNKDDIQEMYELLFVNMIKEHLGGKMYELCQDKLKEFSLTKDPNFLWCAHDKCGSGFIYEGDRTRPRDIQCPNCRNFMCWKCKKPWEAQHQGISCEQFAQWKRDNDPEAQELGLAAHLNDNGIECPACHARYELARGGCMHFKCTRCPVEFCSGCGESIKKGKECGKFNSCATKGLHAHHPRDCLFYLRDLDVQELQDFLKENKMDFNTDAPKEQIEAAKREKRKKKDGGEAGEGGDGEDEEEEDEEGGIGEEEQQEGEQDDAAVELHCRVEEQKECIDGLKDEVCGKIVEKGHAGLCNIHYKEYLVNIINKHGLDPVTIYETDKVKLMLMREEIAVLEQEDDEDDQQYRERLIQHVQENLNLTGGRKAGEAQAQAAAQVQAAPAQGVAARLIAALEDEDDD